MRHTVVFLLALVGTFIVDQGIKDIFTAGYELQGDYISLELHFNKGVAFSMLAFLGSYLKWIQALFIFGVIFYLFKSNFVKEYAFALGLVFGGAIGNLYDRFTQTGVVDYIYWHKWFNYPVFNYADVMVLIGVGWIIFSLLIKKEDIS